MLWLWRLTSADFYEEVCIMHGWILSVNRPLIYVFILFVYLYFTSHLRIRTLLAQISEYRLYPLIELYKFNIYADTIL